MGTLFTLAIIVLRGNARPCLISNHVNRPALIDESDVAYPGWKIVLAGFFGVMVSFASIVPYTFGLFLQPLTASFGLASAKPPLPDSALPALTLAAASARPRFPA